MPGAVISGIGLEANRGRILEKRHLSGIRRSLARALFGHPRDASVRIAPHLTEGGGAARPVCAPMSGVGAIRGRGR